MYKYVFNLFTFCDYIVNKHTLTHKVFIDLLLCGYIKFSNPNVVNMCKTLKFISFMDLSTYTRVLLLRLLL